MNSLAPVILFVYNRPMHMRKTLEALCKNALAKDTLLYIVSDGPKPGDEDLVLQVREIARHTAGFREVVLLEREDNWGIEKSETEAITDIIGRHGKMIALEDDILVNEGFLHYMNRALDLYREKKQVYYITGYNYMEKKRRGLPQTFFLRVPSIWGWATWQDRWAQFEASPGDLSILQNDRKMQKRFNCENGCRWFKMLTDQMREGQGLTWDICWYWTVFKNNGLVLYPRETMTINHGLDGTGVHCGIETGTATDFAGYHRIEDFDESYREKPWIRRRMSKELRRKYNPGIGRRGWMRLRKILRERRSI